MGMGELCASLRVCVCVCVCVCLGDASCAWSQGAQSRVNHSPDPQHASAFIEDEDVWNMNEDELRVSVVVETRKPLSSTHTECHCVC